jgi:hypothetical protein
MIYFDKYIKYKLKYLALKKQYGGNIEYLYHGTSFFYIDNFIKDGLQGKYPDELFNKIKEYWPYILENTTNGKALTYVPRFINKNISEDIQISLTTKLHIAKEYSGGERVIGEGPTYFTYALGEYLYTKKTESNDLLDNMRIFYITLTDALQYPSLILAIKVNEIVELNKKEIEESYEFRIDFSIKPDKLYIMSENGPIKLLSEEGTEYIKNTKIKIEETKRIREEKKRIEEEKLKEWNEDISLQDDYKSIIMRKNTYYISVVYDIYKDEYINIEVQDSNETLLHIIIMLNSVRILEIKSINKELQDKLNYIINKILAYTNNNKDLYKSKIKEHLNWILLE